jgi:hypothetical protein
VDALDFAVSESIGTHFVGVTACDGHQQFYLKKKRIQLCKSFFARLWLLCTFSPNTHLHSSHS